MNVSSKQTDDDCVNCVTDMAVVQPLQKEVNSCKVDLLVLSEKVDTLELAFKESTNSTINRKIIFRQSVDASLAGLENYIQVALEKLERSIKDYFLR